MNKAAPTGPEEEQEMSWSLTDSAPLTNPCSVSYSRAQPSFFADSSEYLKDQEENNN